MFVALPFLLVLVLVTLFSSFLHFLFFPVFLYIFSFSLLPHFTPFHLAFLPIFSSPHSSIPLPPPFFLSPTYTSTSPLIHSPLPFPLILYFLLHFLHLRSTFLSSFLSLPTSLLLFTFFIPAAHYFPSRLLQYSFLFFFFPSSYFLFDSLHFSFSSLSPTTFLRSFHFLLPFRTSFSFASP